MKYKMKPCEKRLKGYMYSSHVWAIPRRWPQIEDTSHIIQGFVGGLPLSNKPLSLLMHHHNSQTRNIRRKELTYAAIIDEAGDFLNAPRSGPREASKRRAGALSPGAAMEASAAYTTLLRWFGVTSHKDFTR